MRNDHHKQSNKKYCVVSIFYPTFEPGFGKTDWLLIGQIMYSWLIAWGKKTKNSRHMALTEIVRTCGFSQWDNGFETIYKLFHLCFSVKQLVISFFRCWTDLSKYTSNVPIIWVKGFLRFSGFLSHPSIGKLDWLATVNCTSVWVSMNGCQSQPFNILIWPWSDIC